MSNARLIGHYVAQKYRTASREQRGTTAVARQLRKQGYPLWLTLRILGVKDSGPR